MTSDDQITKAGNTLARDAHIFSRQLAHVVDATSELVNHCEVLATDSSDSSSESVRELREHMERSRSLLLSMKRLTDSLCQGWTFLTASTCAPLPSLMLCCLRTVREAEDRVLQSVRLHIDGLQDVLARCGNRTVIFAPACQATAEWLRTLMIPAPLPSGAAPRSTHPSAAIESMLLVAQHLRGWSQKRPQTDNWENVFGIRTLDIEKTLQSLRFHEVLSQMESYLKDAFEHDACHGDFKEQEHELVQIRAFLEEYLRFSRCSLLGIADWIKGVLKLAWIVCGLVYRLAREGLCKPSDAPESSSNADATGDHLEGTGMGSGTGDKDVSNEVEDASQVEGLQSEEQPSSQRHDVADEKDEDDALEMEEDFEGDLMDPRGAEGDEDEAESDGDSEPDLDEKIQDIDENDANAIDEKFWGGEQGPEDSTSGKDQTHDAAASKPKDDADIVAKADKEADPRKHDADGNRSLEDDQLCETESQPEDMGGIEELPDDFEQPDQGRRLDEALQEADTLDLPEDMDLDLDADGGSDGGVSLEEAMDDEADGHSDHTDHDVETGQAEAGDAAMPQEEGRESAESDAAQGEVPMSDSAAEAYASDNARAQDAQDGQKGGPAESVSGQVGSSTQETKELPSEENEQKGSDLQKEALGDAEPMPHQTEE